MPSSEGRPAEPGPAPLSRRVRSLLDSMGPDANAVARHLQEMGVRGDLRDPSGCAIAAYLSSVVGSDPAVRSVRVSHRSVVLRRECGWRWSVVSLPRAVRLFVSAFDAAAYPNLVRPTRRPVSPVAGKHVPQDGRA